MQMILSPALNMKAAVLPEPSLSQPLFLADAHQLASLLREFSPWELESQLRVNPQLALRAHGYYQDFGRLPASPALPAFHGLAFQHLDAQSFSGADLAFAQRHLYVLSALYGVLRPLDGIFPYRLDFMGRFRVDGKSLYAYWGDRIYRALFAGGEPVINLCSGEYARLVEPFLTPRDRLVTCRFLVRRGGRLRCVTTEAKMARGRMVRFAVRGRVRSPEQLREFRENGFEYVPNLSHESLMSFVKE